MEKINNSVGGITMLKYRPVSYYFMFHPLAINPCTKSCAGVFSFPVLVLFLDHQLGADHRIIFSYNTHQVSA